MPPNKDGHLLLGRVSAFRLATPHTSSCIVRNRSFCPDASRPVTGQLPQGGARRETWEAILGGESCSPPGGVWRPEKKTLRKRPGRSISEMVHLCVFTFNPHVALASFFRRGGERANFRQIVQGPSTADGRTWGLGPVLPSLTPRCGCSSGRRLDAQTAAGKAGGGQGPTAPTVVCPAKSCFFQPCNRGRQVL